MAHKKSKKKGGKWIQKAAAEMERKGTKGSYGKSSAKKDAKNMKKGGKMAKKANFARNMRKIAAKHKRRGHKSSKK